MDIPFYSNTEDNTHCWQACLKMVLKVAFPEKDFTWEELEQYTGKSPGMATWPMASLVWMQRLGFDVKSIENFDYSKFLERGADYLQELWGKEAADWAIKNSDIEQEYDYSRALLSSAVIVEQRLPSIEDIKKLLDQGYLCICTVNSRALNGKDGVVGHFVLVIGYDDNGLVMHDPGLPPQKNRYVTYEDFERAWTTPTENYKAISAFKLNK
jgi:hypothetical protein